jgi:hypothetical protein
MPSPVSKAEHAIGIRAPNRSTIRPIKMPEIPQARARLEVNHPKVLLENPKSLHMGMINRPKLNMPAAWVAKFTIKRVATMIQP